MKLVLILLVKRKIMAKPFLLFPSFDFTLLFVYMSTTLK